MEDIEGLRAQLEASQGREHLSTTKPVHEAIASAHQPKSSKDSGVRSRAVAVGSGGARVGKAGKDDWAGLDATAQAELVATGQASPRELVEAAIRRIEALDGALGAVPVRFFEEALCCAEAPPGGPLRGFPS
jgi:amidase